MKKFLKILLIITLVSSIISSISFMLFDYPVMKNHIKNLSFDTLMSSIPQNIDDALEKNIGKRMNRLEHYLSSKNFEHSVDNISNSISSDLGYYLSSDDFEQSIKNMSHYLSSNITSSTMEMTVGKLDFLIQQEYKYLSDTLDLEEFDKVNIQSLENLSIKILKGDTYKAELYTDGRKVNIKEYIEFKKIKSAYYINEIFDDRNKLQLVLYTPNPDKLSVEVNTEDTLFIANTSLKSLDINADNAVLSLSGENSYDININSENSVINMNLKDYDAKIKIFGEEGVYDIFGKKYLYIGHELEENIKNSRDNITINTDNSVINIK